ncbi:hypothetical protein MAR_018314, partial [Mya arenaria]
MFTRSTCNLKLVFDQVICFVSVKYKYPTPFNGLGMLNGNYKSSLKEGSRPFVLSVPRRIPILLLPK